jgi:hypothetical protein
MMRRLSRVVQTNRIRQINGVEVGCGEWCEPHQLTCVICVSLVRFVALRAPYVYLGRVW